MTIRPATREDWPAILACLRAAFGPYEESYTPGAYRDTVLTAQTLRARLDAMSILVAIAEAGEIIGTIACSANGRLGHLRGMAVVPDCQGKDVARALLEAAEVRLREMQCTHVTLDTTEPLQRATRFYQKHGYRASGRVSDFFGMPLHEYVKSLSLPS